MNEGDKYKLAEAYLYNYTKNKRELFYIVEVYKKFKLSLDVHAQNYIPTFSSAGQYSDPTGQYVERCMKLESKIKVIQGRITPVERLNRELFHDRDNKQSYILRKIMKHVYFQGMRCKDFCKMFKLTERTFYRKKRELVFRLMERL